ncbi:extracellular solute-binding protein [Streptomyces sp. NBC_01283]|uniref:extracellular solute-binding protein n=1 Tax=Streptomyces sp. NBC_01283 TaxID=2903812 RepID=UPI00352EE80C|nr:extracellular solute-binding protein [Streptomyces sp. NBC_01283]
MRRRQFLTNSAGLTGASVSTLGLGLSACSPDSDTTTLKVLVASYDKSVGSSIGDQWGGLVSAFEKAHPTVRIALERVPFDKLDRTLARRVKDGEAPDIAQSNVFAPYAEDDQLYGASELFDIRTEADFTRSYAEAGSVKHIQYGIPFLASTPRLFYNKALFKQAGLTGAPTSWGELRAAAVALKGIGVKTPYGLQLGPEAAEDEALSWLLADEGGYAGLAAGYDFNTAANVRTLTWLRDELVAKGLAGADPAGLNRTAAYEQFMRGRIGMLIAHPVLMGAADKVKFPYAHAAFPTRSGGAAAPVGLSDWLMAFKRNGHGEACGTFLSYLYGRKSAKTYGGGQAALPVTGSASAALRADPAQRPLWKFIDQMPQAQFQPVSLRSWPTVRAAIRKEIGAAVTKGGDPGAVLASLDTTAAQAEL